MRLVFKKISKKKNRYSLSGEVWLPEELIKIVPTAFADIVVYKRDTNNIVLQGDLNCKYTVFCDRCGERLMTEAQSSFDYLVTIEKEESTGLGEVECSDEGAQVLYLDSLELELDIGAILLEQTYLAMPIKKLCSESCKGICVGCGVSLNSGECVCLSGNERSPFAVLKKLKKN